MLFGNKSQISKSNKRNSIRNHIRSIAAPESLEDRKLMAADLYGQMFNVSQTSADWGDTINVQAQIRQGNLFSPTSSFQVQWYLSDDASISGDDLLLEQSNGQTSRNHPGLSNWMPSTGNVFTAALRLPKAKPVGFEGTQYHVIMKTDSANNVPESNETNNAGQRGQARDRDVLTIRNHESVSNGFRDASHDATSTSAFSGGALRYGFDLRSQSPWWDPIRTDTVRVEAIRSGSVVASWDADNTLVDRNELLNLNGKGLSAGWTQFRVLANRLSGTQVSGATTWINIQSGANVSGDFTGETFQYSTFSGSGVVIDGEGGTDTLDLGISQSVVSSFNGQSLSSFDRLEGAVTRQAIYQGSTYDFLRLTDGREIYFQGIERLRFSNGSVLELALETNDPQFDNQWNLHTQDVPGAWRFTQGSENVLLVTLDTGVLTPADRDDAPVEDMSLSRLITDANDDDDRDAGYGHGHKATSIMAATVNNNEGIAGINWNSPVLVTDVYGEISLNTALEEALAHATARGQKVVFQGGIQGESWLNDGHTQSELEDLIEDNASRTLFAVAAGNGNQDIDDVTPGNSQLSGGVARLAGSHGNVIAVGAASAYGATESENNTTMVAGRLNTEELDRRSYSNFGDSLTMMAATDVPAVAKSGGIDSRFGGTSAANPNMAAIASLVWSALPGATGQAIRTILTSTATDLATAGRDDETGVGMVNAEGAVRKAIAEARDPQLAGLFQPFQFLPIIVGRGIGSFIGSGIAPDAAESTPDPMAPIVSIVQGTDNRSHSLDATTEELTKEADALVSNYALKDDVVARDAWFASAGEETNSSEEQDGVLLSVLAEDLMAVA